MGDSEFSRAAANCHIPAPAMDSCVLSGAAEDADNERFVLLYVEDEFITRDMVCSILQQRFPDLIIHCAEDGAKGLQLFLETEPDLVITDIKMPVMFGIDMARRIMALRKVPIIVTSALGEMNHLIEFIEIGISRYVMKPIDREQLFVAIEGILAAIKQQRKFKEQQEIIHKLSQAVQQSSSCTLIVNTSGVVEYVNPKFTELTGYRAAEVLGRSLQTFQQTGCHGWHDVATEHVWRGEVESVKKCGERYCESVQISPLFDGEGAISHFVVIKEDITGKKLMQQRLEQLANFDVLTGLYNRSMFIEVLSKSVELACRNNQVFALLYLDLDGFKLVNDIHGHETGDLVLKRAGARLLDSVRSSDTVGRMGGDEFTVVLGSIDQVEDAGFVAEKILRELSRPMELPNGATVKLGASIGIGVFPDDGTDFQRLLAAADRVMYEVKREGKGGWRFFSQSRTCLSSA